MIQGSSSRQGVEVFLRVDVDEHPAVLDRHLHDRLRMRAEDGAAADVAADAEHLGEEGTVDEHGISAQAAVRWNDDAGAAAPVLLDEEVDRPRRDERLIAEDDE